MFFSRLFVVLTVVLFLSYVFQCFFKEKLTRVTVPTVVMLPSSPEQVFVNDTGGLSDRARVFIYLLREDQRVRFVLRQSPDEVKR